MVLRDILSATRNVRKSRPPKIAAEPFVITASMIKWLVGVIGGIVVAYAGWKVVWDDIRTYWRLEQVQQQKDKETEQKLKTIAQKAEVGRAWVFFSITDFKAEWREQQVDDCRSKKGNDCARLSEKAAAARTEAAAAKAAALETGKDK